MRDVIAKSMRWAGLFTAVVLVVRCSDDPGPAPGDTSGVDGATDAADIPGADLGDADTSPPEDTGTDGTDPDVAPPDVPDTADPGTDGGDDVPPDTDAGGETSSCPGCPDPTCAYCQTECTADAQCAEAAAAKAVKVGTCAEAACVAGQCAVRAVFLCCQKKDDCEFMKNDCVEPSCELVSEAGTDRRCVANLVPGCCADKPNSVKLSESFAVPKENLDKFQAPPQGWKAEDKWVPVPGAFDPVSWYARRDPNFCYSGSSCLNIAYADGSQYCNTYYNGATLDGCLPAPPPAEPGTRILLDLTAPAFSLEPDLPHTLAFQLRMDAEPPFEAGGQTYAGDHLELFVDSDVGTTRVFDSADWQNTTKGLWRLVSINLSAWSGKTVTLRWRFDTGGPEGNEGYEGVFIDDVRVESICSNASCTKDCVPKTCMNTQCALFQKLTDAEADAGFCYEEKVAGCETCATAADCDEPPEAGAQATCAEGICKYSAKCAPGVVFEQDFASKIIPGNWNVQDDPVCGNAWTVADQRASTGAYSLYFGDSDHLCDGQAPVCPGGKSPGLCPTYGGCANVATEGAIELAPVTLPAEQTLLLSFDLFLSTEFDLYTPDPANCFVDKFCLDTLRVLAVDKGPNPKPDVELWNSYQDPPLGSTLCAFEPVNVDLGKLKGQKIALKFEFTSFESTLNDYEGVYIDNIKVNQLCGTPCTKPADCPNLGVCSPAACVQGVCEYTKVPECCEPGVSPEQQAAQCSDGSPCTVDTCGVDKKCKHALDDKDATCCSFGAVYWSEAFEGSSLPAGWKVLPNPNDDDTLVAWQWTADVGKDGSAGLYFGNPATKTYEDAKNPVLGGVVTPELTIPPGGDPTLVFDLWLSTEFDDFTKEEFAQYVLTNDVAIYDRLAAFASTDNGNTFKALPVWRSEGTGQPLLGTTRSPGGAVVWQEMAFSLKDFAGKKKVKIKLEFDSGDAKNNAYGGVKIDNVRVSQMCPAAGDKCPATAWCEDGDKCTLNTCEAGKCALADNKADPTCCFAKPQTTIHFDQGVADGWFLPQTQAAGGEPAPVQWQVSSFLSHSQKYSLGFVNGTDGNYSGCPKSACPQDPGGEICDGWCAAEKCTIPKGVARSPKFTLEKGKDYQLGFWLYPGLSVDEGSSGYVERFHVKLMVETPDGQGGVLSTLVCHSAECDDPGGDPCKSGKNFDYPGCNGPNDPGDYNQWNHYQFKLSDVLCNENGSIAETFVNTMASGKPASFWVEIDFQTYDNIGNCGPGLFFDDLELSLLCTGWNATCQ